MNLYVLLDYSYIMTIKNFIEIIFWKEFYVDRMIGKKLQWFPIQHLLPHMHSISRSVVSNFL